MEVRGKQRLILNVASVVTSLCFLIAIKDFGRGDLSLTTVLSILGAILTTLRYFNKEKITPIKKLLTTLKDDYLFKNNITPEELDKRITTDPHSPGEWRINGTLSNIPESIPERGMIGVNPASKTYVFNFLITVEEKIKGDIGKET